MELLRSLFEILIKPSQESVETDITNWTGTLMSVSEAPDQLGLNDHEQKVFAALVGGRLSQKIAGSLPGRHRDRPTLESISQKLIEQAGAYREQIGIPDDRKNYLDRAANMLTAAYMNPEINSETKLEGIKNSIKAVR